MQGDKAEKVAAGLQPLNGETPFLRKTFRGFALGDAAHAEEVARVLLCSISPGDGYNGFCRETETMS